MMSIGLEASKAGIVFCVLEESDLGDSLPGLISGTLSMPKNSSRAQALDWIYREILELLQKYPADRVVLKRSEVGLRLSRAVLERAEVDGVVQASLSASGSLSEALPWATIAKRLDVRNRALALEMVASSDLASGIPATRHSAIAAALVALRSP